jgi:hypothetical protein
MLQLHWQREAIDQPVNNLVAAILTPRALHKNNTTWRRTGKEAVKPNTTNQDGKEVGYQSRSLDLRCRESGCQPRTRELLVGTEVAVIEEEVIAIRARGCRRHLPPRVVEAPMWWISGPMASVTVTQRWKLEESIQWGEMPNVKRENGTWFRSTQQIAALRTEANQTIRLWAREKRTG